jgi:esterase/lipase superfamily enzyme
MLGRLSMESVLFVNNISQRFYDLRNDHMSVMYWNRSIPDEKYIWRFTSHDVHLWDKEVRMSPA